MELRELCYGLSAEEVRKRAKSWSKDTTLREATRDLFKTVLDPPRSDKYASSDITSGLRFLEQQYPGMLVVQEGPTYERRLEVALSAGDWVTALDNYELRLSYRNGPMERLRNALNVARHANDIEESDLEAKAETDITMITTIRKNWETQAFHADTLYLPQLRQNTINMLKQFLNKRYGLPGLQEEIYKALLEAQAVIDPRDTSIKEAAKSYLTRRLEALNTIPQGEESVALQKRRVLTLLEKTQTES